jgi:hypothetical protein
VVVIIREGERVIAIPISAMMRYGWPENHWRMAGRCALVRLFPGVLVIRTAGGTGMSWDRNARFGRFRRDFMRRERGEWVAVRGRSRGYTRHWVDCRAPGAACLARRRGPGCIAVFVAAAERSLV